MCNNALLVLLGLFLWKVIYPQSIATLKWSITAISFASGSKFLLSSALLVMPLELLNTPVPIICRTSLQLSFDFLGLLPPAHCSVVENRISIVKTNLMMHHFIFQLKEQYIRHSKHNLGRRWTVHSLQLMRTFDAVTGHRLVSNQLRRSALSRITDGLMPDISADQKVGCPGSVAIGYIS